MQFQSMIQKDTLYGFLMLNFLKTDIQDLEQIHSCLNDKKIKIETLLALN